MRKGIIRDFLITLGFMTRLGPVIDIEAKDLARTVKWMPLSGLVLGSVIVCPFYLGLFADKFWIQAWLSVGASVYLTRGLHFDGIADIADGAGPYPDAVRFWEIIKDSRSGVFGILASVIVLLGQVVCFYYIFEAHAYAAAIWIFIVGRMGCSAMCRIGRPFSRPGQGVLFMDGADWPSLAVAFISTILTGFLAVNIQTQITAYVLGGGSLLFLFRLAKKVNGANGDFLGGAVVLAEISGLLAFAALN
ncbi:adenosylcobinamide-GDP ribazoletransferase [Maridesulfovibrio zosterae]|uniref:adenosylcobinamide-GDP ribazoletransferase n=1 Tax=Maridesulfovibrio zosterae TaxID=82171 RepID=UPI00040D1A77|nr:adenosylcobinamide-GDP ribazoletransferase [Maridesulfovibrio zosterae]